MRGVGPRDPGARERNRLVCPLGDTDRTCMRVAKRPETRPSREVYFATKVRDQGRAALGRYPLIGDRLGQCLASDGFETRIGKADKAKPIQTKKFAIHTLGHVPTFATPLRHVWKAAITRHSAPNVGNAAMIGPSSRGR